MMINQFAPVIKELIYRLKPEPDDILYSKGFIYLAINELDHAKEEIFRATIS